MKKLLTGLLAIMVMSGMFISVNAYETASVTLNGQYIQFDQEPIIENGRTLVPMRKIFEAMGCDVFWYEESEMIDVYQDGENIMTLWVDDYDMWIPDRFITLDVPPKVINDRTLVPIRAISESIGAKVEWDAYSWTVIITYSKKTQNITSSGSSSNNSSYTPGNNSSSSSSNSCRHTNTMKVNHIDTRTFRYTGSKTTHIAIEDISIECKDCGETIMDSTEEFEMEHIFENGVCTACGYVKDNSSSNSSSSSTIQSPSSLSGAVSDYIDGAFMNIVVPPNQSICVPNTSNGSMSIKMDGVGNALERKSSGDIKSQSYNDKDKKSSISISKESEAVIQNSGNSDLIVSIPSEYAQYNVTNEKVYETLYLSYGDSARIVPNNNQQDSITLSSSKYEYIMYNPQKNSLNSGFLNGPASKTETISKEFIMIMTASEDLELFYCPATMDCSITSEQAFNEITVSSGETIRISANDTSKVVIYTDGKHEYDYVTYSNDGKIKSQKQGEKTAQKTINKNCYMDLTNTSGSTITVKVSSLYSSVK